MITFINYIKRIIVIMIGFSAATLGAALTFALTLSTIFGPNVTPGDPINSAVGLTEKLVELSIVIIYIGSFGASLIALPALVIIVLAEIFAWRSPLIHASLGAILGAMAYLVWQGFGQPTDDSNLVLVGITAGIIGASIYWLIAGRNAGKLLDMIAAERSAS